MKLLKDLNVQLVKGRAVMFGSVYHMFHVEAATNFPRPKIRVSCQASQFQNFVRGACEQRVVLTTAYSDVAEHMWSST